MQVGAVALEARVGRDADADVEVACPSPARGDLAAAAQPQGGAVVDAGGDADREAVLDAAPCPSPRRPGRACG